MTKPHCSPSGCECYLYRSGLSLTRICVGFLLFGLPSCYNYYSYSPGTTLAVRAFVPATTRTTTTTTTPYRRATAIPPRLRMVPKKNPDASTASATPTQNKTASTTNANTDANTDADADADANTDADADANTDADADANTDANTDAEDRPLEVINVHFGRDGDNSGYAYPYDSLNKEENKKKNRNNDPPSAMLPELISAETLAPAKPGSDNDNDDNDDNKEEDRGQQQQQHPLDVINVHFGTEDSTDRDPTNSRNGNNYNYDNDNDNGNGNDNGNDKPNWIDPFLWRAKKP